MQFKVIFLGDSTVGKTSLLLRFWHGQFMLDPRSTIAVEFHGKETVVDGQTVTLYTIDTAGQERFCASIPPIYFRNASAAVVVYDTTNVTSFKRVTWWINYIREMRGEDILIMVTGNKTDLHLQKISTEEGKRLAKQLNAMFSETSCKTGDNVENLFTRVTTELIRQNGSHTTQVSKGNQTGDSQGTLKLSNTREEGQSFHCCSNQRAKSSARVGPVGQTSDHIKLKAAADRPTTTIIPCINPPPTHIKTRDVQRSKQENEARRFSCDNLSSGVFKSSTSLSSAREINRPPTRLSAHNSSWSPSSLHVAPESRKLDSSFHSRGRRRGYSHSSSRDCRQASPFLSSGQEGVRFFNHSSLAQEYSLSSSALSFSQQLNQPHSPLSFAPKSNVCTLSRNEVSKASQDLYISEDSPQNFMAFARQFRSRMEKKSIYDLAMEAHHSDHRSIFPIATIQADDLPRYKKGQLSGVDFLIQLKEQGVIYRFPDDHPLSDMYCYNNLAYIVEKIGKLGSINTILRKIDVHLERPPKEAYRKHSGR